MMPTALHDLSRTHFPTALSHGPDSRLSDPDRAEALREFERAARADGWRELRAPAGDASVTLARGTTTIRLDPDDHREGFARQSAFGVVFLDAGGCRTMVAVPQHYSRAGIEAEVGRCHACLALGEPTRLLTTEGPTNWTCPECSTLS